MGRFPRGPAQEAEAAQEPQVLLGLKFIVFSPPQKLIYHTQKPWGWARVLVVGFVYKALLWEVVFVY